MTRQDWDEALGRRGGGPTVGSAAAAAAEFAVTAVTAVPMSLPVVGSIVRRIRHQQPDQRVNVIHESPEDSCTYSIINAYKMFFFF